MHKHSGKSQFIRLGIWQFRAKTENIALGVSTSEKLTGEQDFISNCTTTQIGAKRYIVFAVLEIYTFPLTVGNYGLIFSWVTDSGMTSAIGNRINPSS